MKQMNQKRKGARGTSAFVRDQITNLLTDMLDICDEMMRTAVGTGDDGHAGMCGMH